MKTPKIPNRGAVPLVVLLMNACGPQAASTQATIGPVPASSERSSSEPLASEPAVSATGRNGTSNDSATPPGSQPNAAEDEGVPIRSFEALRAAQPPPMPAGTKVLHVGDSFAGALGLPLGSIFEQAGVRSVLKHTDASYLTDWAWDGNLQKYIWKYNPDLIIITLGANELEISEPELRAKTIKKIVATVGDVPCVWVAIPLWAGPKNGLLDVIARNVAPCVYMDTNTLMNAQSMPRIHDGIHPTASAREAWASDVALWLREARRPTPERPWSLK
jgi:hypothetical protein